ncbi:flagellar motor protein MotB [Hydrogenophaga sp. PBL-H3]|uniref:flagellar motor protein MotB n=1 Tax=Hydrogenophaga sp. PBL-H3 TaxID=434010 RepID=UPI00131FD55E|nr:flagellar motor protein MotB [Hydrogenophaga sp. PBL-H3]QHE77658.1 flagellar motor protein MotB [Hydrogenophaga sp. PBL-H3]QHE82082.1 flagellar motor protein MotB [Hydrogenophaga sp. PBL-H3]
MADGKKLQPIIIKRIKKSGHAAHGGAWKIAYADFVTAMMAFFLLMWLLGSTAKGELDGIASYFQSPVKVSLMGGPGTGNSSSILPGGGRDLSKSFGQMDSGEAERAAKMMGAQMAQELKARQESARLDALEKKITVLIEKSPKLAEFGSQIQLEKTTDGLHIQIVDQQNRPMFDTGSSLVKPYMRDILHEIGKALGDVENSIALAGHTDATPYGSGERGYSNWELSADRANASRRELVSGGLPDNKLRRVEGLASSRLLRPETPTDPINRRISIVVMTQAAEDRMTPSPIPAVVAPGAAATVVETSMAPALQIPAEVTKSTSGSGG